MKWGFDKFLILESEQRQKRRALRTVLIVGAFLALLKGSAYYFTNSTAVLSDVLESVINLAAGSFALFSLHYAAKPRDSRHPYGRGKIEFLAATVQGSLIFGAGALVIFKAIYNIFYEHAVESINIGFTIIAITTVINFLMGKYMLRRAIRFDSLVLKSDGSRLLADAYSSAALCIGLVLIYFTRIIIIDSILAILSGILIICTGYKLVKQSVKGLLDAADTETLNDVVKVLQDNSRPAWIDLQNMRASHYGMYLYIDCHITLPWYWNLKQVNDQVKDAELLVNKNFKERVEMFVQAEPCMPRNCPMCRIADCPVRQHPYKGKKPWRLDTLLTEEVGGELSL